ncbi:MAG: hypothetical protein ACUZ8E_13425 [Candidatus Anammoxibacter sp.]
MFQRNNIKQDELLNKLLSNQGSIAEKTDTAKSLDNEHLQKAVPSSDQAKVEWERRANEKQWYQKPLGLIAMGTIGGALSTAIGFLFFGCK